MILPVVPPGMEKPHDPAGAGLYPGEVGTLQQVAVGTSQGEVLRIVSATMLSRDDVLNVKAQFGILLREVAGTRKDRQPGSEWTPSTRRPSGSLGLL